MPLLIEDNSMHEWILWRLKVSARTSLLSGPVRVALDVAQKRGVSGLTM